MNLYHQQQRQQQQQQPYVHTQTDRSMCCPWITKIGVGSIKQSQQLHQHIWFDAIQFSSIVSGTTGQRQTLHSKTHVIRHQRRTIRKRYVVHWFQQQWTCVYFRSKFNRATGCAHYCVVTRSQRCTFARKRCSSFFHSESKMPCVFDARKHEQYDKLHDKLHDRFVRGKNQRRTIRSRATRATRANTKGVGERTKQFKERRISWESTHCTGGME